MSEADRNKVEYGEKVNSCALTCSVKMSYTPLTMDQNHISVSHLSKDKTHIEQNSSNLSEP